MSVCVERKSREGEKSQLLFVVFPSSRALASTLLETRNTKHRKKQYHAHPPPAVGAAAAAMSLAPTVPETQYPGKTIRFLASGAQALKTSSDCPPWSIPGVAKSTQGPGTSASPRRKGRILENSKGRSPPPSDAAALIEESLNASPPPPPPPAAEPAAPAALALTRSAAQPVSNR